MDNSNVVNTPLTPEQAQNATPQVVSQNEDVRLPAQPGSKTEPTELLQSLRDEREKRRLAEEKAKLAEEELNNIKSSVPSEQDAWSDEGKILQNKITSLEQQVTEQKEERDLERLYNQYPLLREKADAFKEYRKAEHPRAKIESVAKLYLSEEGLLEPKRKGLENPTGGSRTPMNPGMTSEEVKHLRETDPRKYREMIKKDLLKIE